MYSLLSFQPFYNKESSKTVSFFGERQHLKTINFETEEITEVDMRAQEYADCSTAICRIPGNKIFCFGGGAMLSNTYSGMAFTIDSSNNIEFLQSGKPCCDSSCVYLDGYVYAFGGYGPDDGLNLCERFAISENRWQKLAVIPGDSNKCSCVAIGRNILYAGVFISASLYDVYANSHSGVLQIDECFDRIVFEGNNRGYVIQIGGNIYESEINNLYNWSAIGNFPNNDSFFVGNIANFNNKVYFMFYSFAYKFDLNRKKIEEVKKITQKLPIKLYFMG